LPWLIFQCFAASGREEKGFDIKRCVRREQGRRMGGMDVSGDVERFERDFD
jgi:hypothetical protein